MRFVLLVGLAIVGLVQGNVVPEASEDTVAPGLYYHEKVGIPEAARIKEEEDRIIQSFGQANLTRNGDSKIVGGAIAAAEAYPYLAGLLISFSNIAGRSACGSSILTASRLVTAAHCWFDGANQASSFEVVLGSQYLYYYGTRVVTSQVITHPSWTPSLIMNDVAMIYLPYAVAFTTVIQPVAIPGVNQLTDTFEGQWAFAAGYGKTSDLEAGVSANTMTRHVSLRVISNTECASSFSYYVQTSTLCTSGLGFVGICGGDSGGPLVLKQGTTDVLIGISSFVASGACHLGYPSAFARVTSFYSFIVQHLY